MLSTTSHLTDNFVRALRYYIALSGKTKKEIAEAIGVPPTTFSSWSNGKHLPDMEKLQHLSKYLGAPISHFFEFTPDLKKPDPLLDELTQTYKQLSNEDKLLVRAVTIRLVKPYIEE